MFELWTDLTYYRRLRECVSKRYGKDETWHLEPVFNYASGP